MKDKNSKKIEKSQENLNKEKKDIKPINVITGFNLILIVIALIIKIIIPKYSIEWFIYTIIMLVTPIGIYYFFEPARKTLKRSQRISKIMIMTTLSWLYETIIMFLIFGTLICKFIFGIIGISINFYGLSSGLGSNNSNNGVLKISMIIDLILGIFVTIYLLYLIPDKTIQTISTAVIAAVYGGLLTLAGVSWTIKRADYNKKQEEIEKYKPLLFVCSPKYANNQEFQYIDINKLNKENPNFKKGKLYEINKFFISNSDYSFCSIAGIVINDDIIRCSIGQVLDKNKIYCFDTGTYMFNYEKDIERVYLLVKDILNNYYVFDFDYEIKTGLNSNVIDIISGVQIIKAKVDLDNYKLLNEKEIRKE